MTTDSIDATIAAPARVRALVRASRFLQSSTQAGLAIVIAVSWIVFELVGTGFLSSFNLFTLGRDVAIDVVIGLSQMVVLAVGRMNLAVGAIGVVVVMFTGWLMQDVHVPALLAVALGLALGALAGWFNGWLEVKTGVNSFIITLATASIYTGLMLIVTKAGAFRVLPFGFTDFGTRSVLSSTISPLLFVAVGVTAALFFVYRNATLGWKMLAVGANERAARLSGVSVPRMLQLAQALSGLLAGLAGILLLSRLGSAVPALGSDWLLPSFVAPVLGGTSLTGGGVAVVGTLLGALLVTGTTNGLNIVQISSFWIQVFLGLALLVAVMLDRLRAVTSERRLVLR